MRYLARGMAQQTRRVRSFAERDTFSFPTRFETHI